MYEMYLQSVDLSDAQVSALNHGLAMLQPGMNALR
jgi:hypothetical protein